MFSGKLSQCISVSSDKKTADLAFWGAVPCALCSCCSCQGLAKLQTATWPKQELPVLLGCLLMVTPHWWLLGSAHELLGQASLAHCPLDPALGGISTKTWEGAVAAFTAPGHSSQPHHEVRQDCMEWWLVFMLTAPVEGLFRGGNAAPHCYTLSFCPMVGHWDKHQATRTQPLGEQRLASSSCWWLHLQADAGVFWGELGILSDKLMGRQRIL